MSTEDAYTAFNDELDEIISATPERAAAVAEIRAEMDDTDRAYRHTYAALSLRRTASGRVGTAPSTLI